MQPLTNTEIVYRCERGHRHARTFNLCDYENDYEPGMKCATKMVDCIMDIEAFNRINNELSGSLVQVGSKKRKRKLGSSYSFHSPITTAGMETVTYSPPPQPIEFSIEDVGGGTAVTSNTQLVAPTMENIPSIGALVRISDSVSPAYAGRAGIITHMYGEETAGSINDIEIVLSTVDNGEELVFNLNHLLIVQV